MKRKVLVVSEDQLLVNDVRKFFCKNYLTSLVMAIFGRGYEILEASVDNCFAKMMGESPDILVIDTAIGKQAVRLAKNTNISAVVAIVNVDGDNREISEFVDWFWPSGNPAMWTLKERYHIFKAFHKSCAVRGSTARLAS